MKTKTQAQTTRIQKHLELGRKITALDALNKFGCLRLAARINELRNDGMAIQSRMVTQQGKRFAQYSLA